MAITSASTPSATDASPMFVRLLVAAALAGAAAVHLVLAGTYAQSSVVVGGAFIIGGLVAIAAGAWLLLTDSDMAWDLAAGVSAGMLVALLLSATVGLFGIKTSQVGVPEAVSLLTEVSVLVAWGFTRLPRR